MTPHVLETPVSRAWSTTWRAVLATLTGAAAFLTTYGPMTDTVSASSASLDAVIFIIRLVCDIPIGIGAIVIYCLRRRNPFAFSLIAILLGAVSMFATGAALLALISIAARRRPREIAVAGGISITIGVLEALTRYQSQALPSWPRGRADWENAILTAFVVVLAIGLLILIGALIGTNRGRRHAVVESALSAQRAAEAELSRAKSDERTRIAREMHDALAHRLSLVAMHAGALEYRSDLSPDQVRSTAKVVSENSRRALEELRDILGVLRASDFADARTGQPGAADVPRLVAEASDAVQLQATLPNPEVLDQVPAALGLHLYRTVQEALTNHRKHAPNTRLTLTVTAAPGTGAFVVAENPLGVPAVTVVSSGHGLGGVAERIRLAGGTLRSGTTDGRYRMEAWLPWQN